MTRSSSSARFELEIRSSAATNTGLKRELNEDSVLAEYPVFVVADGMGGHDAGDRASAAVVDVFRTFGGRDDVTVDDVTELTSLVHHAVLRATGSSNAGSTLTGVIAVQASGMRQWLVVNIGDSRVYRLAGNHLAQLTVDHSLAQELIDNGELTREQARTFSGRNIITRAFGDGDSTVDVRLIPITPGERLLVCSDGLTGEVSDEEIAMGLLQHESGAKAATWLIDRALTGGGRDNITVIVIDAVQEHAPGEPSAPDDVVEHTIESRTIPSQRRAKQ